MASEEKRKAKREQAFIPPVEEKPKKETKKKGKMIFCKMTLIIILLLSLWLCIPHYYSYIYHKVPKVITPLNYWVKFQFAGFFAIPVILEYNSKMGMLLHNYWNRLKVFFPHSIIIIVFAENDSKVDVEAFKKKIKNSQVRSICSSSSFVCLRFQKKKRFLLQKLK